MYIFPVLALIFAALEAFAVWKNINRLQSVAKPAVMIFLFAWLYSVTRFNGAAFWFGLGILFSLCGDLILLWWLDTRFLLGLLSFLFAHITYLIGFNVAAQSALSLWTILMAVIVGLGAARVLRRIIPALRAGGRRQLVWPVMIYGGVISLMLLSALLTLSNPAWEARASLLVSLGAFLFYVSDIVLAWNMFITPLRHGHLLNIILYHLGQIALVAGVVLQFS